MTPNQEQNLINAGAKARQQGKHCNPPSGSLVVQDAWIKGWEWQDGRLEHYRSDDDRAMQALGGCPWEGPS